MPTRSIKDAVRDAATLDLVRYLIENAVETTETYPEGALLTVTAVDFDKELISFTVSDPMHPEAGASAAYVTTRAVA